MEDLASGFADVERGCENGGEGAGEGAGGEGCEEGGCVVVLGVGECRGWIEGDEAIADGFVAPPVETAEGDVAPHC